MANELIIVEETKVLGLEVFTENGVETLLAQIKNVVDQFVPDMTSDEGRKEIKAMARKVASTKTFIEASGKALVADWTAKTKSVNVQRAAFKDRLDVMRDQIRKPVTEWEDKEKSRVAAHCRNIAHLNEFLIIDMTMGSSNLKNHIEEIEGYCTKDFEEYKEEADIIIGQAIVRLRTGYNARLQYEKDQTELEEMRKEKEERLRQDEADKQAKAAAEEATRKAEAQAKEAKEESQRKEWQATEDARLSKLRAEQAIKDKGAAEAKARFDAEEAEKRRVYDVAQAELRAKNELEAKRIEKEAVEKEAKEKNLADVALQSRIKSTAANTLARETGLSTGVCATVFDAIKSGKVTHLSVIESKALY